MTLPRYKNEDHEDVIPEREILEFVPRFAREKKTKIRFEPENVQPYRHHPCTYPMGVFWTQTEIAGKKTKPNKKSVQGSISYKKSTMNEEGQGQRTLQSTMDSESGTSWGQE